MTATAPATAQEHRLAAWDAIKRMKTAWPAWTWSDDMQAEYGRALMAVGDPDLLYDGITQVIRRTPGKYPPAIADVLQIIEAVRAEKALADAPPPPIRKSSRSVDESALADAIAALDYAHTHDERTSIEQQIASIRRRLPDDLHEPRGIRYLAGAPDRRDPPGTLRFVVVHPDGTRNPRNGRLAGE